jgi:DNA-binding transcriptional ArsR family regulator
MISANVDMVMPVRSPHSSVATVFRALGDDTRLQMLALLRQRAACVCEFVELFGISQPAVSEHLRRLRDAGLVSDQRRGMWVFYSLREPLPAYVAEALRAVEVPPEVRERFASMQPAEACRPRRPRPAGEPREAAAR